MEGIWFRCFFGGIPATTYWFVSKNGATLLKTSEDNHRNQVRKKKHLKRVTNSILFVPTFELEEKSMRKTMAPRYSSIHHYVLTAPIKHLSACNLWITSFLLHFRFRNLYYMGHPYPIASIFAFTTQSVNCSISSNVGCVIISDHVDW